METRNIGILTSVDWNSNGWKGSPTQEDISNSNFSYVSENDKTHTYLNFGYNDFPTDGNGYFYGLLPQLWSRTPQSKYLEVIFVKSQNWSDKKNYIIGLYFSPILERRILPSEISGMSPREVNIKAYPKDIHHLQNYIHITPQNESKFLPKGKELGKQGFNYLTKENVLKILDAMTELNPNDKKLSSIKFRLIQSLSKRIY